MASSPLEQILALPSCSQKAQLEVFQDRKAALLSPPTPMLTSRATCFHLCCTARGTCLVPRGHSSTEPRPPVPGITPEKSQALAASKCTFLWSQSCRSPGAGEARPPARACWLGTISGRWPRLGGEYIMALIGPLLRAATALTTAAVHFGLPGAPGPRSLWPIEQICSK